MQNRTGKVDAKAVCWCVCVCVCVRVEQDAARLATYFCFSQGTN